MRARPPRVDLCRGFFVAATLLLAACGSQPPRPASPPPASEASEAAPPSASPPARPAGSAARKSAPRYGGAYYKDDGPGEDIPDNLDEIPDATPRAEALHRFANRPYVVLGKSYVPNTSLAPFRQRGVASWYGKKFHGQNTSIGEPYDMFAMTAAHPTLAIPSYVRVTRVATGKSVVVRVTDRGPFHADRVIDLSYAAAHRLGYVDAGSTQVEVESVFPGDTPTLFAKAPPVTAAAKPSERDEIELLALRLAASETSPAGGLIAPKGVYLQLGAFSNQENAETVRSHLARELDWLRETIQIIARAGTHRVHLGPYASRAEAEKTAERIRQELGYKPVVVR